MIYFHQSAQRTMNLRLCIALLWLLFPTIASGQSTSNTEIEEENSFWRKYIVDLEQDLHIPDLDTVTKNNCIRLWADDRIIEIWQQNKIITGYLTHWTKEVAPNEEEETGRYYTIREVISPNICDSIAQAVAKFSIAEIPSSEKIPGWENGFDGIEYIIEIKNGSNYICKNYWTPTAQGELKEAKAIQSFVDEVLQVLNAKSRREYFWRSIPFDSWSTGSIIHTRITTNTEYHRMKQERNRYRRSKNLHLQSQ